MSQEFVFKILAFFPFCLADATQDLHSYVHSVCDNLPLMFSFLYFFCEDASVINLGHNKTWTRNIMLVNTVMLQVLGEIFFFQTWFTISLSCALSASSFEKALFFSGGCACRAIYRTEL